MIPWDFCSKIGVGAMVEPGRRVRKVNFRVRNPDLNTTPFRTRQVPGGYGEFRRLRLMPPTPFLILDT